MLYLAENDLIGSLNEIPFQSEREMQRFCERHLGDLLGLSFVASEFTVSQFRLDSVAYDKTLNAFVVIEYKNKSNFSVVDQGYSYISSMLEHKADFVLEYNHKFHVNKRIDNFEWGQVRVIFIAPSYTPYQIGSINFGDLPMDLYKIKKFERGIIQFEQIQPARLNVSIKGYEPVPATQSVQEDNVPSVTSNTLSEIKAYTEDDHVSQANDDIRDIYQDLRDFILSLDESIKVKATKLYIAFLLKNHNLFDIKIQRGSLMLWINARFDGMDDPKHIIRDVTHVGHHGNGDCQIKISDSINIGYIKNIMSDFYTRQKENKIEKAE